MDDKKAIELWYAGLGKLYYKTRSRFATVGCHDSAKQRRLYYVLVGFIIIIMSISLFFFAWFIREFLWLTIISLFLGLICIKISISFFRANSRLTMIINAGSNADSEDPLRMKTIRRAVKWGKRKGLIHKDPDRNWCFHEN